MCTCLGGQHESQQTMSSMQACKAHKQEGIKATTTLISKEHNTSHQFMQIPISPPTHELRPLPQKKQKQPQLISSLSLSSYTVTELNQLDIAVSESVSKQSAVDELW